MSAPSKNLISAVFFALALPVSVSLNADTNADALPGLLEFKEWQVPWQDTRPRDPYVAPDGTVWFVGQVGNYVARLDPESGEMKKFDIPDAGPHTVVVNEDGTPWYAGNKDKHIGKMNPQSGEVTLFTMPDGIDDPHTMGWTSKGNLWFTAQWSNYIARLDTQTGKVEKIALPSKNMRPYGLVVGPDDRPWVAFMGDNAIGTVNPETLALDVIETPTEDSLIRRIGMTSDGRIWWGDNALGHVGVYDPQQETMQEWSTPGGEGAGIYAMAVDNKDRIWYVETGLQPNRFVGFDSRSEAFISIDAVPSGGITIRHMVFDPERNAIWFATDANTVGKAVVPE
jgi:virginiamycin B lyase